MPPHNGVRLDNHQHRAPASPEPRKPHPEDAVALSQSRPLRLVLKNGKLLPEGEVLGGQMRLSSRQRPKEDEDHVHRPHTPLPNPLPLYMCGQA